MTTVDILDRITRWVEENVCQQIKLKMPNDDKGGDSYSDTYDLVTPAAFTMFVPPSDRLPDNISPVPSVCVRMMEGNDDLNTGKGRAEIQLCFSAWDTGLHGKDVFKPVPGKPLEYEQSWKKTFRRNGDGWRDAWNFLDGTRRAIENAEIIDGLRVVKEEGIKYGPLKEQDNLVDYYPLWYAWMSFFVEYGNNRIPPYYKDL